MEVAIKDREWISGRERLGVISIWGAVNKTGEREDRCQNMEG